MEDAYDLSKFKSRRNPYACALEKRVGMQVAGRWRNPVTIDIDKLTEPELVDLNNRIVARLRFLQQMRAHASMLAFSLGERVSFQPDGHPVLFGVITKYNRKSVTVITETGQHWTVAPTFLRKIKPVREGAAEGGQVISLPRK